MMTKHLYAIISDIHGNYNALLEVGRDARDLARKQGFPAPEFIFLGDAVDYGPQPNEVMHWLARNKPTFSVIGNHDQEAIESWSKRPRRIGSPWWPITMWTRLTLKQRYHEGIGSWHIRTQAANSLGDFLLFHSDVYGDHRAPKDEERAAQVLREMNIICGQCAYGLFGHSHFQSLYLCHRNSRCEWKFVQGIFAAPEDYAGKEVYFLPVNRWHKISFFTPALINPGGVGQPRHHTMQTPWSNDVRASYMLLYVDDEAIHFQWRRIKYDVEGVVELLQSLEMPSWPSSSGTGKDILYNASLGKSRPQQSSYFSEEELAQLRQNLPKVTSRLAQVLLHGG